MAIGTLLATTDIFVDVRTKGHFSSVLLEAQFFDVVTLASDNESSQKIISGGNGMFFEQGNPEDLCSKINFIIENSDLLSEIRRNRIKWLHDYGEKFVEKSCFGEMETIYLECLND